MTGTKRASGTMVSDANDVDLLDGLTLDTTAAAASPLYGSAVTVDKPGDVAFVLTTATVAGTAPVLTIVVQQSDSSNFYTTDTALTVSTTTAGVAPVNEVQLVTPANSPNAGTWTITYAGQTTSAMAFDADAATIELALEALSNVGVGDITVTGGPISSGVVTLTFTGALAGTNVAQITCDGSLLTSAGSPTVTPSTTTPGVAAVNEVQLLTPTGTVSGGTFTLTYDGQTTSAIAFDASPATITTALDALSNLAPGDVVATGGATGVAEGVVTLTFGGTLAATNVAEMTEDDALITGGGSLAISTSVAGVAPVNEVQLLTVANVPTAGTWTITYSGQTTSAIAYNANAATIQTALNALSNVGDDDIVVTGGPISAANVTLTFSGAGLDGTNVDQVTVNTSLLTNAASPTLTPSTSVAGVVAVDEVQRITPTSAPPNGGTFTITWEGQTTSALAYNASAATIQTAMEALSNIGAGECVCAGGPINEAFVSFTFTGALGGANQDAMTIDTSGLTSLPDVFTLNTLVSTGTGEDTEVYSGVAHVNKKYVRAKVTVADGGTVDADYTGTTLYVRQPHWHRTGDTTERTIV